MLQKLFVIINVVQFLRKNKKACEKQAQAAWFS